MINTWHEYFMKMAELAKLKSKDRSTQVGAVIVNDDHIVLSTGYNGFPRKVSDDVKIRHERPEKYMYTEHAERNAIYAAARNGIKLLDSTIYVTGGGGACADCARAIIQAGICKMICMQGKFEGNSSWQDSINAGNEMLKEAGVKIIYLDKTNTTIFG